MHIIQGAAITEAALRGSMVGWQSPAARLAVLWEPGTVHTQENRLPKEMLKQALSIQQPLSELILTGEKTEEYRSRRTLIRERVYLYAGKKFKKDVRGFAEEALLPRGVIFGSACGGRLRCGIRWMKINGGEREVRNCPPKRVRSSLRSHWRTPPRLHRTLSTCVPLVGRMATRRAFASLRAITATQI
jgi:hypothetical protein